MSLSHFSIKPSFLFGVRSGVNNGGIHFVSGNTLLYPAGAGVALINVQNNKQEVVALTGKGSHISSLTLNPNRNLVAFTEYGDRQVQGAPELHHIQVKNI